MTKALSRHWPEYLMEAAGLGLFMLSACVCAVLLEQPGAALHQVIPDPLPRRLLMGLAMALTAGGIIYSPWGQQSGAHINPAVTLSFWYLGKIEHWDAVFYVIAQFLGAVAGVWLAALVLGQSLADPPVSYIITLLGITNVAVAFLVEMLMPPRPNVTFAQPEAKSLNYSKNDDGQAVAKSMGIQRYPPSE